MSLPKALQYIYDLERIGIKFGLNNTNRLLESLGNPHLGLKVIHISGTNGKGSTAAMVMSILKSAGYRVGLYTSPHLISLSERIQINGDPITEGDLTEYAEEMRRIIEGLDFAGSYPTFFEVVTCIAFAYFFRQRVDFAVMEVGMGGRLDATNVCIPMLTIITNISLEHQEYLGNTIAEIAGEKAGIVKAGCPLVCGVTQDEALAVIRRRCDEVGAPLCLVSGIYRCEELPGHFGGKRQSIESLNVPHITVWRAGKPFLKVKPKLIGRFQCQNIPLALESAYRLREMGIEITGKAMKDGLRQTVWPGRMHVVSRRPLLVLDGAHNPDAAKNLADAVQLQFKYRKLLLVMGILKDKDIAGICRELVPIADQIILCAPVSDRAGSPEEVMGVIESLNLPGQRQIEIHPSIAEAISKAKGCAGAGDLILITGSLYTIGEAMKCMGIRPYEKREKHNAYARQ